MLSWTDPLRSADGWTASKTSFLRPATVPAFVPGRILASGAWANVDRVVVVPVGTVMLSLLFWCISPVDDATFLTMPLILRLDWP